MGDNSGPGRRKCFGVSLVDLGDVEGFDSPPISNQVYGLEFANGIYRRKDIPTGTGESNLLDTLVLMIKYMGLNLKIMLILKKK